MEKTLFNQSDNHHPNKQDTNVQKIVIVGGGTAGWITAAVLSKERPDLSVTLIESQKIGTIGVGEATIPPILDLLNTLQIDLTSFIKATNATFKLGIEFQNWKKVGHSYLHPFGAVGQSNTGLPFYDHWLASTQDQSLNSHQTHALMDYSPAAKMCQQNKFYVPSNAPNTPIEAARYALHFDANLVAKYLKEYAIEKAVEHIDAKVEKVHQQNGIITHLLLDNDNTINGDFFIDCTGFAALLIGQTQGTDFEDWSHMLTVNRAVTFPTKVKNTIPVYTRSVAHKYGWSWHIPLQHRTGNGYVFNSELCDDQTALQTLVKQVGEQPLQPPRFVDFKTGVRPKSWQGNCVAVGLSSGFLEPLESTAIHMITRSIKLLLRYFPTRKSQPVLSSQFNKILYEDYIEIRNFLLLHYALSERTDSEFWLHYQQLKLPAELTFLIDLFKERGALHINSDRLFVNDNWYAIFEGMNIRPRETSSLLSASAQAGMNNLMTGIPSAIDAAVNQLPSHNDFIKRHCGA